MTSNSEVVSSQPRPVSSNSEVSSKGEKPLTPERKTKEKHPISEQDELNKSETSSIDLVEEYSASEHNEGKIQKSQHEITTIAEETEKDINNSITLSREDNHYGIEGMEENKNRCLTCLTDVFYCTIWYFRNMKDLTVSCLRRCCNCSGFSDSDEPDANYVYSDLNETFNNDLSGPNERGNYSFDNSGADIGNRTSYDVGSSIAPDVEGTYKSRHHDDTVADIGHRKSHDVGSCIAPDVDGTYKSGHHSDTVADVNHRKSHDVGSCFTSDVGGTYKSRHHDDTGVSHNKSQDAGDTSKSGHHGDTFTSAGDVGTSHSGHDGGTSHSGDVGNSDGHFSSGADYSFGGDTSGGDGGGHCGGGDD